MPRLNLTTWGVAGLIATCLGISAFANAPGSGGPTPLKLAAVLQPPKPAKPATPEPKETEPNEPEAPARAVAPPMTLPRREPVKPPADLLEMLRAAKSQFTPASDAEVQAAWGELWRTAHRLQTTLRAAGANGTAWKQFLNWDVLTAQFQRGATLDLDGLRTVRNQFSSGEKGLEHPQFLALRRALQSFIEVAAVSADSNAKGDFEARLDEVIRALEAHAKDGSFDELDKASRALDALENSGRAPAAVAAVRKVYSQPNLSMAATSQLVVAGLERDIDDTMPIRDNIRNTLVVGSGHTIGKLHARLLDAPAQAVFHTEIRGVTHSRTTAFAGPVIVSSTGVTQVRGIKQFQLDADGFHSSPARSEVSTNTRVTGLSTTKRGLVDKLIRHIAWKRMPQEKAKSERIGEEHAEAKFSKRMNEEAGELLSQANARFNDRFRYPLLRMDEFPRVFGFSTTPDSFRFVGLHEGGSRFGAPIAPPELDGPADLTMRLHESLVNNMSTALLAGMVLNQARADEITIRVLGELPDKLQEDDREPWSVTFAKPNPVTFRVDGDLVELTVRGHQYTAGTKRYDGMNVTVRYKLACTGHGIKAERQGELDILPPDFVPGKDTLSTRQQVLRRLLQRRYGKIFEPEMMSKGLTLTGRWEKLGPLHATQMKADRGWIVVGWNYDRPTKTAAAPAPGRPAGG